MAAHGKGYWIRLGVLALGIAGEGVHGERHHWREDAEIARLQAQVAAEQKQLDALQVERAKAWKNSSPSPTTR